MSASASDFPATFDPLAYASRVSTRTAQKVMSVDEIGREIIAVAQLPLSQARTLPAQAYTSEEFFEWEMKHVLRAGWQCLAHVSQIPEPGDFKTRSVAGRPLGRNRAGARRAGQSEPGAGAGGRLTRRRLVELRLAVAEGPVFGGGFED